MKKQPNTQTGKKEEDTLPGYPEYPESEDVYSKFKEEKEVDPVDTSQRKEPTSDNTSRRKSLDEVRNEDDLDVPGSELDDQQEAIGSEDEENNYYSLGGDNHD